MFAEYINGICTVYVKKIVGDSYSDEEMHDHDEAGFFAGWRITEEVANVPDLRNADFHGSVFCAVATLSQ